VETFPPRVTCIIIFLNEERFLREAISSVLEQSYANWELLLVDDGSSDQSTSIAYEYSALHPGRIRYLSHDGQTNRGMSASRNLGIQQARGDYIAFLDGDDVWLPHKLEEQIAIFERNPSAVMVCGATEYWYEGQDFSSLERNRVVFTGEVDGEILLPQDRIYHPPILIRKIYPLGRGASPSNSGHMITREFARAVGGFENAFRGLFEDQVFRAKVYLQGPIYVSSSCFDRYRQHPDSCVYAARASGRNIEARRAFFLWLRDYLDRVGCSDPMVYWQLQWVRMRYEYRIVAKADRIMKRLSRQIRRFSPWVRT
jgi:glycosyltransferase involved in cell wall biosynthesis